MEMIFNFICTRKELHLASFWIWGFLELRNGLLIFTVSATIHVIQEQITFQIDKHSRRLDTFLAPFQNSGKVEQEYKFWNTKVNKTNSS